MEIIDDELLKDQMLFHFEYNDSFYLTSSQKEKIIDFLNKYKKHYPVEVFDFILDEIDKNVNAKQPAVIRQILDANGLYHDKSKNPYFNYLQIFEEYFSYNQNIIDVGAGFYPASSIHIKEQQTNGTLTVYDPFLLPLKRNDIILKKEEFTLSTNIEKQDLLFGIMPCESTRTMIQKANDEHKNLFLGLCGCSHYNDYELNWLHKNPDYFNEEMYYMLQDTNQDNCEITIIPENKEKSILYPILIKKLK